MASGRITGSVTSNSNKFNFFLDWRTETNIEENYSTVYTTTYWSPKSGYEYWDFDTTGARNASITIDGSTYSISKVFYTGNDWSNGNPYQIMTHYKKVYHNDDGTKSIVISARANGRASDGTTSYGPSSSADSSGDCLIPATTVILDTIPRASTVSATTANIGSNPTITISRASSTFTHTLRYKFGSLSGTIVEKTSSTSYSSWKIPTDFYYQIPNDKYGTGTIYCDTYNGSTLIGTKECSFRANVANSEPTITAGVSDIDTKTTALTGNTSKLVKYYSDASVSVGASALNGASLKEIYLMHDGKRTDFNIGAGLSLKTFSNVENSTFTFVVTDSRGYSTQEVIEKPMVDYIKLTCDIRLISATADGTIKLAVSGNYFNQSFGAVVNTLSLSYRMKEQGGNFPVRLTSISNTIVLNGNTYQGTIEVSGLDYKKQYIFQAVATDKLATVYSSQLPVTCDPVFDWGREDFNLNVNFNMNGETIIRHNKDANNTVLSASGGFIYFRPQGTNETTGEIKFSPQGNIELTGDIIINGKSLKSLLGI